jgi:hypothetical protein
MSIDNASNPLLKRNSLSEKEPLPERKIAGIQSTSPRKKFPTRRTEMYLKSNRSNRDGKTSKCWSMPSI